MRFSLLPHIEHAEQIRDAIEKARCEDSLLYFFERAWREIDKAPLKVNWHHDVIAEELERLAWGESEKRNILINQPPRTTKTVLTNIAFPAWVWIQPEERRGPLSGPQVKFLCVSYGATLSETIGQKMLLLVQSEWYQKHWGDRVKIDPNRASRADFANTAGGERMSTSVHGALLGRGGDCLTGDTEIITEGGPVRINELDISASPRYILTYDADTKTPTYRRIIAVVGRGPRKIWRIHTRSGCVVSATAEHSFFTRRGWVPAMALADGDVLLRALPKTIPAPSRRNGKVGNEKKERTVLQSSMQYIGIERETWKQSMVVPRVRKETSKQKCFWESVVQRRVSAPSLCTAFGDAHKNFRATLRDLRKKIYTTQQYYTGSILLSEMQGCGALEGHEGHCQSDVSAWQCAGYSWWFSGKVEADQRIYFGTRRLEMYGVRTARQAASGSPYRLESEKQQRQQSRKFVRNLPQKTSCLSEIKIGEDSVSLVEEICEKEFVYDIQVEGTKCFFANGILVHNCQIIDDPQDPEGAESEAERESTIRIFSEGLPTRVTDPQTSARIMVAQRLHELDCSGWVLTNEADDWTHLNYPMRAELYRLCPGDPRTQDGELLWPEHWSEREVARYEARGGEYFVSGQFQQRPVPRGGGLVKREWIEPWPPWNSDGTWPSEHIKKVKRNSDGVIISGTFIYPAIEYIVGWVDTAFTENVMNDFCAMIVMGIFRAEGKGRIERRADGSYVRVADDWGFPKVLVLHGWLKRLTIHGPPEEIPPGVTRQEWAGPLWKAERQKKWGLVEWVADTVKRFKINHLGINALGGGHTLDQELRREHADLTCGVEIHTERFDKVARLLSVQGLFSSGQIFFPAFEDGSYPTWLEPMADQLFSFPKAQHDDAVDAQTGALRHLRDIGIFERKEDFDKEELAAIARPPMGRIRLPYEL